MDILLVTAYYPLQKSKYNLDTYNSWLSIFFECVTCSVIFFCSSETYLEIHSMAKSNVQFVQKEFDTFDMMKEPQMNKWKEWHNIDPEKNIHSPELYAIWAAKQEFIREAINLVNSNVYIWCDAGCFRTKRNGSFENTLKFISPEKITCLDVTSLCDGEKLIGGAILAGDKNAWFNFSRDYLNELERSINGKDQVIFQRIINNSNAIIISPTYKYGDPWFYLTYLFSKEIIFKFEHYIDQVIYINLEHRKDRKDRIEKELSIFPKEKVQRFNAIYEPERGHFGCSKSHIEVLKLAIKNNWKNYLVVEDDMEFTNFKEGYKILENLVDNTYDVIILGGTSLSYDVKSYRLYNCCCTTAYIVSNHYYSKLLKNFEEGAILLDKKYSQADLYAIDQYWHILQCIDNWYCIFPVLCKQISDYSDIDKKNIDKELLNYTNILTLNPKYLTIRLQPGLGNQLFQLAFLLYASRITQNPIFLETLTSPESIHSSEQYFETLLKKWKSNYSQKQVITTLQENSKMAYENWKIKINSVSGNIRLKGYFQRFKYVNLIRDEFISRLTFNKSILKKYPDIQNKFFIHIRGGDYLNNSFHFIDLCLYYNECIEKHKDEEFIIFTNDISYANSILPNFQIIEENEVDTLYLMSQSKGCICSNSSFSWWGAYLNPNRPIYFPDKWFNDPSMDTSGLYFNKNYDILEEEEEVKMKVNINLLRLSREKIRYRK